ncbi:MAG: SRPBCC family protein, partial [Acidobacteria bacterium]|nr:SRPBCC family protein [Acidobacteriota bacterium]
ETLRELDDEARLQRYSIDDGPEAVSKDKVKGYIGEVRAFAVTDDDSTFVLWTSSWESSEGGVQEFCDPIYRALLAALKSHFAS